jgi:hypothetical protein
MQGTTAQRWRDLRRILHLEKNESHALTVVVGKIDGLRLQICRMDWMVAPSFPAFAAAFPDSTGMLTFSKNRMLYLLTIWFFGFTQRHLTLTLEPRAAAT